jgi:protein SCO1/2
MPHLRSRIGLAALLATAVFMLGPAPAIAAGPGGPGYFPNVSLTTQDGKVVHFYDDLLKGKSVVINLIYTHCSGACPLETAKLSQVQRLLGDRVGKDIFFYSISIDPTNDTPEAMKAYADRFHVQPGWLFLTGKKEDIKLIGKRLGLTSLTDAASLDGHQPALMAMTILHFFDGYQAKPVQSYADMGPAPKVSRGEYLFKSRCTACHTVGKGDRVGPDLLNVTRLRDRAWLARYVAAPDRVLAAGDPIAKKLFARYKNVRMPNLGLSVEDVDNIIPYMEELSRAAAVSSARKDSAK